MIRVSALACILLCALALAAGSAVMPASAQQPAAPTTAPPQPPYGAPITLDQAKRVMAAAERPPHPGRRQDRWRDRRLRCALGAGRSDRQSRRRRAGEGDVTNAFRV